MTKVFLPGIKFGGVTITSDGGGDTASITINDGETDVTTVTAIQPHGGGPINYSITGGADAALFDIIPSTGLLYSLEPLTPSGGGGSPTEFLPHFPVLFV